MGAILPQESQGVPQGPHPTSVLHHSGHHDSSASLGSNGASSLSKFGAESAPNGHPAPHQGVSESGASNGVGHVSPEAGSRQNGGLGSAAVFASNGVSKMSKFLSEAVENGGTALHDAVVGSGASDGAPTWVPEVALRQNGVGGPHHAEIRNPKSGGIFMNGPSENGHAQNGSQKAGFAHQNGVAGVLSGVDCVQNGEAPGVAYPSVVGLQPVALVDHVARVDWSLLDAVPGERGGSMRVTEEELDHILHEVNSHFLSSTNGAAEHGVKTLAGGSVANTIRGLACGLGVSTALVGVRGDDDRGQMFAENMANAGVDLSRLRAVSGLTAQCACLVDAEGNRTMRPCFLNAVRLQAEELSRRDFKGAKWVVLNGYGFYGTDLLEKAIDHCKMEGVKISMDLASFEVVRNFRPRLMKLLESRKVDLVFANEDEARELIKGEENPSPETCLKFLARYCETAVVMLGSKGCIAHHGDQMVRVPAIRETRTVDTTGAGDLFASGFLYGILNNLSLEDCCKMGCCTGGAVVRGLGGEVGAEGWEWMQQQLKARNLPPIKRST